MVLPGTQERRQRDEEEKSALSKTAGEKVLLMIEAESAGYDSPILSCGKNQLTMAVSLCVSDGGGYSTCSCGCCCCFLLRLRFIRLCVFGYLIHFT